MSFLLKQIERKGEKNFILVSTGFFKGLSYLVEAGFAAFYMMFILQTFTEPRKAYPYLAPKLENIEVKILHIISWPSSLFGIVSKYDDFFTPQSIVIDAVGWGFVGFIASLIYVVYQRRKSDASEKDC